MKEKPFDAKKTFGLSVLLKLTRKSVDGVKICEANGRYTSNLGMDELNLAVAKTMAAHNINLRLE